MGRPRDIRKFIKRSGGKDISIKHNGRDHLKVAFTYKEQRANFTFPQTPKGGGELYKMDINRFMRNTQKGDQ